MLRTGRSWGTFWNNYAHFSSVAAQSMPLNVGSRIAHYDVTALIGEGGMGQVYQATDTKLNRQVALKILPEAFATDPDRLARFQREAQVLASLNHPGIAAIYGIEEQDDTRALVLELVEGPTLADRISKGPIPVDEALPIAKQIAEALEAAHEAGVIHRDLKPANIKVKDDGTVKVLDFGLAKALDPSPTGDPSQSPTLTAAATQMGVIMGTAAYMSPEQARGKPVDRRADIWSFGVVLYEMLTSHSVFAGADITDTIAAVVRADPDWSRLPSQTPVQVRTLLRRCLQKDLQKRLPHVGIARIEIEEGPAEGMPPSVVVSPTTSAPVGRLLRWMVAGVLLVSTLGLAAALLLRDGASVPPPARLAMAMPSDLTIAPGGRLPQAGFHPVAVSPDGRHVVFVVTSDQGRNSLWLRPLDSDTATELPGTEGAASPFWSPDSRAVAFFAAGALKRVDPLGGAVTTVCASPRGILGTWTDDVIYFTELDADRLTSVVPASGGQPTPLPNLPGAPYFLPDGEHFLWRDRTAVAGASNCAIASLSSGELRPPLLRADAGPVLYSQGHLLFIRDAALMAQPFDPEHFELSGEAVALAEDVSTGTLTPGAGIFSVSENGVLVYRTDTAAVDSTLRWVDRTGTLINIVADAGWYGHVELSPDARQAAVTVGDRVTQTPNIWLFDLSRLGVQNPFTTDSEGVDPIWSPDGSRIAFLDPRQRGQPVMAHKPASGIEAAHVLMDDTYYNFPTSWSQDGQFLVFSKGASFTSPTPTTRDLWALPMQGDQQPFSVLQTPANEFNGRVSPNGRWMAYQSDESGRDEVYVAPFPDVDRRVPVSAGGGSFPRWSRDGTEIFYLAGDNMLMVASVTEDGGRFGVGTVQPLFELRPRLARPGMSAAARAGYPYDVAPDGQRFLVNMAQGAPTPSPITVVLNWPALLEQ